MLLGVSETAACMSLVQESYTHNSEILSYQVDVEGDTDIHSMGFS